MVVGFWGGWSNGLYLVCFGQYSGFVGQYFRFFRLYLGQFGQYLEDFRLYPNFRFIFSGLKLSKFERVLYFNSNSLKNQRIFSPGLLVSAYFHQIIGSLCDKNR